MAISFEPLPSRAAPRALPAHAVVASGGLTVIWRSEALEAVDRHVGLSRLEVAGLLLGWWTQEVRGMAVVVEKAVAAGRGVETSGVHVSFTPAAWDDLSPEIDRHEGLVVVGWYHSHPGLSAFFSSTDRGTQERYFREPWQIGLVIDPLRGEHRLFRGAQAEELDWSDVQILDPEDLVAPASPEVETPAPGTRAPADGERFVLLAAAAVLMILFVRRISRNR